MDAMTFDGISRNLGSVSSRRGFARLLGGAAAMGAVLAAGGEIQARGKGHGNGREQVSAQGKGKGKKITICYLNQTKTVKKSKLGDYPGAARGACPVGGGGQPQVCTRWILSGGPSQTTKISADDDLSVFNVSQGGYGILNDGDRKASVYSPVVFDAKVGDRINIIANDGGGCRSLSELWLHCAATGASRKVYGGFNGGGCGYGAGIFVNQEFIV